MLTLTLQFLIAATLPLSLLAMVVYLWRAREKRPLPRRYWTVTLLVAAVWASSVLRPFGGGAFSVVVMVGWLLIGRYAFGLTLLGVLLTTTRLLGAPRGHTAVAVLLSLAAWGAALGLDRNLWGYPQRTFALAGQQFGLFDLWAATWVTAWLLPLVAAWMLTRRVRANLTYSLFRNQLDYWQLALGLFFVGGALASVQQPGQPGWQQFGILVSILAAAAGTISLTRSLLADLRFALRQLLSRLLGIGAIALLTWTALLFVRLLPNNALTNLLLVLIAGLLALAFTAVYQGINRLARRLLLPTLTRRDAVMQPFTDTVGHFPQPQALSNHFLAIIQANFNTDDAWVLAAQDGSAGALLLRPLAVSGVDIPDTAVFAADSPFTTYLHAQTAPLLQLEVATLREFNTLHADEKQMLGAWQRVLFVPVHASGLLVSVLALGPKRTGAAYDRQDFTLLQSLAAQFGPLLAQAQHLNVLRHITDHVYAQNQALLRENQQLRALADLHVQFAHLLSPALQRPFPDLYRALGDQPPDTEEAPIHDAAALRRQIDQLKVGLATIINIAARIQAQQPFTLHPVQLDAIVRDAVRNLETMAATRRVQVSFEAPPRLPSVLGDAAQLQEAVQHLLHNAIKFNKIGGSVTLETAVVDNQVSLSVADTGVGIPPERLDSVWEGFAGMDDLAQRDGPRRAGLGLTLTRFIVTAHGGRVTADSAYGAGSIFTITLPALLEN